jgi:RNA polymerase sigma-70 factor (ECF subfamily)
MPATALTAQPAIPAPAPPIPAATATTTLQGRRRLDRMFRDHHELIWRTLRRTGLSADGAADVTQQAYLIAAERLDSIRPGCERAYLFSTAIGLARSTFRRDQRCTLEADMDSVADPTAGDRVVQRYSALELMDKILAQPHIDLVTPFVLFELEGLSSREIAELLDIPVGTVASRLRRARAAFRAAAKRIELIRERENGR